jgi:hypothetical protein
VRMHQVRVAQAEARTATAISSEAVAHESLRRIQDQRMQEWTNSGTPIPAIGEAQVLLGTPLVGLGGTIETPPAPPVVTEQPAATAEGAAQPQENGNPEGEDDDELLIPLEVHSAPEDGSPRELHTSVALTQGMKLCWFELRVAPLAFVVVPGCVACLRCIS